MNLRQLIDEAFLARAAEVGSQAEALQNAISRLDLDSSVDRLMFVNGQGHMIGLPTRPGTSSTATTGVPTNAIAGWAPGAIFLNFKGGPGTALYVNIGTNASSNWINIDTEANLVTLITTATITALAHSDRTMLLALSGGFTTTLPAATGTGNTYRFIVKVVSGTGYVVNTTGTDVFNGNVFMAVANTVSTAATSMYLWVSTANKTFTLNGGTTGGVAIGDWFNVIDIAAGIWAISGSVTGTSAEATPFSN